ncbi:hypothetical protein Q5752_001882 [Cryptotrichosporon argae]
MYALTGVSMVALTHSLLATNTRPSMSETPADPPAAVAAAPAPDARARADALVAEGKKAIALSQWEEAVTKYGEALDVMRELVGEFDPAMAPLLLSYGKALYELAFAAQGVMGKDEVAKSTDPSNSADAGPSGSNFVFEGDGDDDAEEGGDAEGDVEAEGETAAADASEAEQGDDAAGEAEAEDEPEDDYNAAWEVLDVARTIYQGVVDKAAETGDETRDAKLALSECYVALGDVSCETENFVQAVSDYTAGLGIKQALLPQSSRALASTHYQLATALEFTPDGRAQALAHVRAAHACFAARAEAIVASASTSASPAGASAGAGAAVPDDIARLSAKDAAAERSECAALMADLEAKIDELEAAPQAGDLVSESINHLLGGGVAEAKKDDGPVNDLSGMVKKKKKPAPAAATQAPAPAAPAVPTAEQGEKRAAEDGAEGEAKRARAE